MAKKIINNQIYGFIGTSTSRRYDRWEPITPCSDRCKLYEFCTIKKYDHCQVEVRYLMSVINPLFDSENGIGDKINLYTDIRIRSLLIPLHHQLIKLLKEFSVVEDLVVSSSMHPILKEIRDVISAISREERTLGLTTAWMNKFDPKSLIPGPNAEPEEKDDALQYVEDLERSHAEEAALRGSVDSI